MVDGLTFDEGDHIVLDVVGEFESLFWLGGDCSFEDDEDLFEGVFAYDEFAEVVCKFIHAPAVEDFCITYLSEYPNKLLNDGILLVHVL